MPWVDPPTKLAYDLFPSNEFNMYVRDNEMWLKDQAATKHGAFVYNTGVQGFTLAVGTIINFPQELEDTDNYHSTVSNNSRLTVPAGLDGMYVVRLMYQHSTAGTHQMGITKYTAGGNLVLSRKSFAHPLDSMECITHLAAGEYVQAWFYSGAGGTTNSTVATNDGALVPWTPHLAMYKVS